MSMVCGEGSSADGYWLSLGVRNHSPIVMPLPQVCPMSIREDER